MLLRDLPLSLGSSLRPDNLLILCPGLSNLGLMCASARTGKMGEWIILTSAALVPTSLGTNMYSTRPGGTLFPGLFFCLQPGSFLRGELPPVATRAALARIAEAEICRDGKRTSAAH